jgi:quinohemoprotein ethanol dehydrogenase
VTGFDKTKNGKPIINQDAYYDQKKTVVIYPGGGGAHNWAPMSYNPDAGLVYLPYSAGSYTFTAAAAPDVNAGGGAHGLGRGGTERVTPMPIWGPGPDVVGRGGLQARDPKTNTIKWVKQGRGSATSGSSMTTASNLLFQTVASNLYVYKADTGEDLLTPPVAAGAAPPTTYMVDGTQYVGFATGSGFLALKVGGTASMPAAAAGGGGRGAGGGGRGAGGAPGGAPGAGRGPGGGAPGGGRGGPGGARGPAAPPAPVQ